MIERLVEGYVSAISKSLHQEFSFLKRKYREDVGVVIAEQKKAYEQNILRHSRNFQAHYRRLEEHGMGAHKEDVIAHFFTDHDKKFRNILRNQERSLAAGPLCQRVRKFTHRTTQDYLLQEEQLYSELLTLVHTRTEKIDAISKKLRFDERYDALMNKALATTLVSEVALLGPLEVLSLPLWGAYFSLKGLQDHHAHFEQWRGIKKHRIH